jgi:hypothetical protein
MGGDKERYTKEKQTAEQAEEQRDKLVLRNVKSSERTE